MAHSFQALSRWQTALRSIANQLEDLERRAKWDGFVKGTTRRSTGFAVHTDENEGRHWDPWTMGVTAILAQRAIAAAPPIVEGPLTHVGVATSGRP